MKVEPTRSELEILQALWTNGPSTVRAVHDVLKTQRDVNYSSVLKLMQIMHEKGLLVRDESQMKHVYSPAEEEEITKQSLLSRFIDTVYNGSVSGLMMQLVGRSKVSQKQQEELRKMLEKFDRNDHND